MIFKWTPGFCLSQSWQTGEQPLAHLRGVDSPIPGPALNSLPGHREGPTPALRAATMEESLGPGLAPYSKSELGEFFFSLLASSTSFSFIHSFIHG